MAIWTQISPGELWDRVIITELKHEHQPDEAKRTILRRQFTALRESWGQSPLSARVTANFTRLIRELRAVNEAGWELENFVRKDMTTSVTPSAMSDVDIIRATTDALERCWQAFDNNTKRNALKREIDAEFDFDAADDKIHG